MSNDHSAAARELLVERWLDDAHVLAHRLEQVHLPEGFPFDWTPASLTDLEAALLADEEGPDEEFERAACVYVGEILMDVCGGRWGLDTDADPVDGEPVVEPDPALGLPPVSLPGLIAVAVAVGSGHELTGERERLLAAVEAHRAAVPGWEPVKERSPLDPLGPQPEDPWLTGRLREREEAFPAWAAAAPAAGPWDFSLDSLDRLEDLVRGRYATTEAFDADLDGAFLTGAVWYLGEVVRRHGDSVWLHWAEDPGAERGSHHHPDNPWSGLPFLHQPHRRGARPLDPVETLRGVVRYGDAYRLRGLVP
ncbi:hypothetical protein [Streptomyces sp. NPDC002057]|uniref:hypothetical protein n=1 Tax=Streptomyces sp. NPDC002057 TaxID=3154664 RepID=UPI0033297BEC